MIATFKNIICLACVCAACGCHGTIQKNVRKDLTYPTPAPMAQFQTYVQYTPELTSIQDDLQKIKYAPIYSNLDLDHSSHVTDNKITKLWLRFSTKDEYCDVSIEEFRSLME